MIKRQFNVAASGSESTMKHLGTLALNEGFKSSLIISMYFHSIKMGETAKDRNKNIHLYFK